jgi:hypothetical protein
MRRDDDPDFWAEVAARCKFFGIPVGPDGRPFRLAFRQLSSEEALTIAEAVVGDPRDPSVLQPRRVA